MADVDANGAGAPANLNDDELTKKIIRQVEFYFGDFNLMRDAFMREKMKDDEGWFTMDVMLKFKRLSTLCSEPSTILKALKTSKNGLLEIDMAGQRIRRKVNRKIPQDNEEYRAQLKARSVYVKGFQSEENIDDIHDFLSGYGTVEGIQLQRTPDKKFKGSLFATFARKNEADAFIQAPMVYYKCDEITKMSKAEFYKQCDTEKKAKKKKSEEAKKEKEENQDLKGTVAMKVSGIDDDTIFHTDIKNVFISMGVNTIKFFDRLEKHASEGYLIFQEERTAEELLEVLSKKQGGTKVPIKSSEVEFSAPDEEEVKNIQQNYLDARRRLFNPRGKKHNAKHHGKNKQRGKKTTFGSDGEEDYVSVIAKRVAAEDAEQQPIAKQAKTEE